MTDTLSPEQLADYLFKGLGRAYVYLQTHDPGPYHETLLHACLYNPVYDRQIDGPRTDYLYGLIQLTGEQPWYEQRILDMLADPDDDADQWQLCELALRFAQEGSARARQLLYQHAGEYASSGETMGAEELLALDGLDGFIFIGERMGAVLDEEHEGLWWGAYALRELEERGGLDELQDQINRACSTRPFLRRYLELLDQHRKHNAADEAQAPGDRRLWQGPYDAIKAQIEQGDNGWPYSLVKWGQHASEQELEQAAHDLAAETDPQKLVHYLHIFHKRRFPLDFHLLLPLAWHPHQRVAYLALRRLARFQHADVRALAFELVAQGRSPGDALVLFASNYEPGDEDFFLATLDQLEDQVEIHDLGYSVREIVTERPDAPFAALYLRLYERGPCSLCRTEFVRGLLRLGAAPDWLREEALHDSDESIRKAVQEYRRAREGA